MKNYKTLSNASLSMNIAGKDFSKNFSIATRELRKRNASTEALKNGLSVVAVAVALDADKHSFNPSKLTSVYKALKTVNERASKDCKEFEKWVSFVLPHMTFKEGIFSWKNRDKSQMVLAKGLTLSSLKGYLTFEYPEIENDERRKPAMTEKKLAGFFKSFAAEHSFLVEQVSAESDDSTDAAIALAEMRRSFLESAALLFDAKEFAEVYGQSIDKGRTVAAHVAEVEAYAEHLPRVEAEAHLKNEAFDLAQSVHVDAEALRNDRSAAKKPAAKKAA